MFNFHFFYPHILTSSNPHILTSSHPYILTSLLISVPASTFISRPPIIAVLVNSSNLPLFGIQRSRLNLESSSSSSSSRTKGMALANTYMGIGAATGFASDKYTQTHERWLQDSYQWPLHSPHCRVPCYALLPHPRLRLPRLVCIFSLLLLQYVHLRVARISSIC